MTYGQAYVAALAADNAYTAQLERVYGANACNARYWYTHADPAVQAAARAKQAADAILHSGLYDNQE